MGFSIKQKIDICLMSEANLEMTQTDLAVWAQKRFGTSKPPSQTTISRILAKKDELIALKEHEFKLTRRRRSSNPLLRKVLTEWITQCAWNNIPITAPIIISSASNFWKQCPPNMRDGSGEFSFRWCSQFLAKVNINLSTIEKDLYSSRLKVWTFEERGGLKSLLSGIDPKKIFTLDEIFLSYDLPLDKALYDDSSDFVTCMLCVNADGSEKLDPLIIGRYENYPSFEGKSSIKASNKHSVGYHSNRMRWLTSTVFYDWLSVLDKRLALTNRDIIIILNDSASHRVVNIKLQRIRLLYTSCNSNFLPMNWGIENDLRLNFRIKQYEVLLERQKKVNGRLLAKPELNFNMAETFDLIKHAWNEVPSSRIQSAWKQSGILPDVTTQNFARRRMLYDALETRLITLIVNFNSQEDWDVPSLMDLTVEQKTNKTFLSNEEIVQCCIVDNYDDFDHTTGQPRRAPFSHTLGQQFQRLKRLAELQRAVERMQEQDDSDHKEEDKFDIFDLDNFVFANDLPDFDMNMNPDVSMPSELQPMSELSPALYANTDPRITAPSNISPNFDTPSSSGDPALSYTMNSIPFTDDFGSLFGTPTQLTTPEMRLNTVMNFINMIEEDPNCPLSQQTKMEVVALYYSLLRQSSYTDTPTN